jgi:serine/threonine protein kinase
MTSKTPIRFEGSFDTYTFVRQIGGGGSGTVFEVTDSTGQHLALKLLTATSTSKLKRFRNEIFFCLKRVSPAIIEVLDFAKTRDGSMFYVMPLYSSTLRERIISGIPPGEVLHLYGRILDGVEAAHLFNVVHRDIKPANLLYAKGTDDVVVADFGIAHFKEEDLLTQVKTEAHDRLANLQYSAPEQRKAGAPVDHRADIFALGLILNEMFTGHVPQGTDYKNIKSVSPQFEYLDPLVALMIKQQPEDRLQSVQVVKEELIGRGNQFIAFQRLDALKKEIVPASKLNDQIVDDPIRAIETVDYKSSTLTLRLNRGVNPKWQSCFRHRATAFNANFSASAVVFQADTANLHVDEYHLPMAMTMFKQYCEAANEEYAKQVTEEHHQNQLQMRAQLQLRVAQQEQKARVLAKIQL